jgi:hypothetical protein
MNRLIPIKEKDLNDTLVIFRNLFFYADKKIKNGLVESLIRLNYLKGVNLTQREAKNIVTTFKLNEKILSETMSELSNEELNVLYKEVNSWINK